MDDGDAPVKNVEAIDRHPGLVSSIQLTVGRVTYPRAYGPD